MIFITTRVWLAACYCFSRHMKNWIENCILFVLCCEVKVSLSCLNIAADAYESSMYGRIQHCIVGFLQRAYNRRRDHVTQLLRRGLFALPEAGSNRLTIYIRPFVIALHLTAIIVLFRKLGKFVFIMCNSVFYWRVYVHVLVFVLLRNFVIGYKSKSFFISSEL